MDLLHPKAVWTQKQLERVQGTYYGTRFTGHVIADRIHTCNYATMFTVQLDTPILVYGEWRERVTVGGYPNRETFESLETMEAA